MTAKKFAPEPPLSFPCASADYPAMRKLRHLRDISEEAFQQRLALKKLEALRRVELGNEIVETVCLAYRIQSSRPYKDEETGEERDLRTDVINEVLGLLWKTDAEFPKRDR